MRLPEAHSILQRIIVIALLALFFGQTYAQSRAEAEAEDIRTTFIYHIANYMSLPDDLDDQEKITFCFIEDAPYTYYNLFMKKGITKLRGLDIEAYQLNSKEEMAGKGCQLAFFSESKENDALFNSVRAINSRVVTIGETRSFVNRGGIVGLVEMQSRVRVLINRREYNRTSTKFSSLLLRHARFR